MRFHIKTKTAVAALAHGMLLLFLCVSPGYADSTLRVNVDTSALLGNPSGPFSLYFQFVDGGVLGNNSATISNFTYGGGSVTGSPFGSALGNAGSTVSFDNSVWYQEFIQEFASGSMLTFDVSLTTSLLDSLGTPDAFSFGILDRGWFNIPTTGLGDSLLLVNIDSSSPTWQTFSGTGAFSNVKVTTSAVPEAASYALTLAGLGLLALLVRRKQETV